MATTYLDLEGKEGKGVQDLKRAGGRGVYGNIDRVGITCRKYCATESGEIVWFFEQGSSKRNQCPNCRGAGEPLRGAV